jgi:hypothetical protein
MKLQRHIYIEGDNLDDRDRDTPLSVDHTRQVGTQEPVNEAILALNDYNQRRNARCITQYDDDLPDLLPLHEPILMSTEATQQLSPDGMFSQLSSFSGYKQYRTDRTSSVQPFTRICGEFRTFELSNEDQQGKISSSNSTNPLSVNFFHNNTIPSSNTSMYPSKYWSTEGIDMTNTPERIVRAIVQKSLAINSHNLTRRLHASNPALAQLPPMNEARVRQWLQEIYPYEFRASALFDDNQQDSLQLDETLYLYQAFLNKHICQEWFTTKMFTPPLAESLALVLRNQRDRFMLDYYATHENDFPHVQSTHHLIWRTVMEHIAYNNQQTVHDHWQVLF